MANQNVGRPKIEKGKSKQPGFSVRLVAAERREIEKAITKSGEEKSEWIRDALLSKARRR